MQKLILFITFLNLLFSTLATAQVEKGGESVVSMFRAIDFRGLSVVEAALDRESGLWIGKSEALYFTLEIKAPGLAEPIEDLASEKLKHAMLKSADRDLEMWPGRVEGGMYSLGRGRAALPPRAMSAAKDYRFFIYQNSQKLPTADLSISYVSTPENEQRVLRLIETFEASVEDWVEKNRN